MSRNVSFIVGLLETWRIILTKRRYIIVKAVVIHSLNSEMKKKEGHILLKVTYLPYITFANPLQWKDIHP